MLTKPARVAIAVVGLFLIPSDHLCTAELDVDAAIAKYRMGTLIVEAEPNAEVRVEQLRHEFWFGAAISSGPFQGRASADDVQQYKRVFLANFNAGVTENAVKWHAMEPRRGQVDYSTVDAILAWADRHEIPVRAHCLFWGVPNRVQPWLRALLDEDLRQELKRRATSMAKRYRGRFAEYDLNNEMMHANLYQRRLGHDVTKHMSQWVHQEDPEALLFVNDYDVLTGNRLDDYVQHIRRLQQSGAAIGGIGVQGHLHGESFDPDALKHALDTLAQFDLPIRVTEFNFPGQRSRFFKNRRLSLTPAEERAKADALVRYYRICFAHPAVHGILMWGFWEGANWIPVSSLYRRDWTPTPAAEAYRELVFKQWWTNWSGSANADGRCIVPAFFGKYRVTVDGREETVELKRADGRTTVSLK